MTLLRAPAGAGKTLLLAEWAHTGTAPHVRGVWVDAAEQRLSRAAFWAAVADGVAAAGIAPPGHPLALGAGAFPGDDEPRPLLRRALATLGVLTLVVDAVDELPDAVHDDLVELVAALPDLHVVAAARGACRIGGREARARVDVEELTLDDLALTLEETVAVLGPVARHDAERVHVATDGVALVVRLVALEHALTGTLDATRTLERMLDEHVAHRPAPVRDFLRTIAAADVVTAGLAAELTDAPDAHERLAEAAALGLGTWTAGPDEDLFVLTGAVRRVLRDGGRAADPVRYRALRRTVATWSLRHGRPAAALHAAVDADDLVLAETVVKRHWHDIVRLGRGDVLGALGDVPLGRLRRHPYLLMIQALALNARAEHRGRAVVLLGLALASVRLVPPATATDRVLARSVENAALRLVGQADRAVRPAREVLRTLAEMDPAEHAELGTQVPRFCTQAGITLLYAGDTAGAVAAFERGLSAAGPDGIDRLHPSALLTGALAAAGEVHAARAMAARVRAAGWPQERLDDYLGSMYHVGEALVALEDFDATTAQAHLDRLERHLVTIEHWPLIAHVQAMVDLVRGDAATGLARLEATRARQHARRSTSPLSRRRLDETAAVLLLALGRVREAGDLVGTRPRGRRSATAIARLHLVAGDDDRALGVLATAPADPASTPRARAERAVVEAALLARRGADEAAVDAADRMAALLEVHGLGLPLALVRAEDRAALRDLADRADRARLRAVLARGDVPDVLVGAGRAPQLTTREQAVLDALAEGATLAAVAARAGVSPNTVKSQVRSLYRKLGADSRQAAVAAGVRYGLLSGATEPAAAPPEG